MGDVILTIPTAMALVQCRPEARVSMLVREYTRPLVDGQPSVAASLVYDVDGRTKPFGAMLAELRSHRFDAAVVAYPRFRIALLLWLAGVPVRIGTAYRWYSWLFNRRIREHRKGSERSEAAFNLSLLAPLGCTPVEVPTPRITPGPEDAQEAQRIRARLGMTPGARLVILHPGSGGSARSWSPASFARLGTMLADRGFTVIATGSGNEKELVDAVCAASQGAIHAQAGGMSLRQFSAFLQTAQVCVANSTGPLHLAAAVGIPVVGIYPPVRVMNPVRWGPLTDRKIIFVPDPARCPRCNGGACQGSDCMEQVTPEDVADAVERLSPSGRAISGNPQ